MKKTISFILALLLLLTACSAFAEEPGSAFPGDPPGGFGNGNPPGDPPDGFGGGNPPGDPPDGISGATPPDGQPGGGFGGGTPPGGRASSFQALRPLTTIPTSLQEAVRHNLLLQLLNTPRNMLLPTLSTNTEPRTRFVQFRLTALDL